MGQQRRIRPGSFDLDARRRPRPAHGSTAAVRDGLDQHAHPACQRDAARRLQAERLWQGHVDLLARGVHADQARHGLPRLSDTTKPPALKLQGIRKNYGSVVAVAGVDLVIEDGEFFTLLGPSGSGKTTLLRMIAGFERPDAGRIELGGRDVTSLPPNMRDTNTVFQDYALFPHMSVAQNIGYGLRIKRIPGAERQQRVDRALRMVRLEGLGKRRPNQLSGGQRQRVALARAVINEPEVLLLDEPLGALDLKLRQEMQIELKQIQKEVGITFVYVTHDQEEALTMSDRVAVMSNGLIEQIGSPVDVYERPPAEVVAGVIGISTTRLRDGVQFVIRPEKIRMLTEAEQPATGMRVEPV